MRAPGVENGREKHRVKAQTLDASDREPSTSARQTDRILVPRCATLRRGLHRHAAPPVTDRSRRQTPRHGASERDRRVTGTTPGRHKSEEKEEKRSTRGGLDGLMGRVVVSRHAIDAIRRGHPWIFRGAIVGAPDGGPQIVGIEAQGNEGVREAAGIYDPESPIAARVWDVGPSARLDAALFDERLRAAIDVRRPMFVGGATTAHRLLNGEGDRTPGFVIDRYDDVAVLRTDGGAASTLSPTLLSGLETILRDIGVTTLLERSRDRGPDEKKSTVRFGPERAYVEVREHGVPFVVDLVHGQKTGAFLDQRENRRRIGELVAKRLAAGVGGTVLNLFSYTGGFSQRAALGGGVVTSVDVAAKAHATAQRSFALSKIDPAAHTFVTADAFAWLAEAKRRGKRFDVVISDPPSFAPNERSKLRALAAYRQLHRACADVLAPGGHFVAASCSSHITAEDFVETLDDAALGRSDLRMLELFGPPPDHPTLPRFVEGRYLKLAILR